MEGQPLKLQGLQTCSLARVLRQQVESKSSWDSSTDAANLTVLCLLRIVKASSIGVPSSRLEPQGFGATRPVADNATANGRALNRRVEVALAK
ncbi:MAG: hypothetical protein ACREQ5_07920 [Candidatus Dormibacteria bacterium]